MTPLTRRSRTLAAAWRAIHELQEKQMATQAEVDALTTQAGSIAEDLAKAETVLQTEIDALSAANPGLDLTKLQAAVSPLDQAAKDLAGLKPTPAPAPTPAPPAP